MRFLFVDRIVQLIPGELVRGVKHVTKDDAYLTTDATGRVCFIPSFIGETLGQLAAWNVMQHNDFTLRPVAGVVSSVQIHRPAYLGETLLLESYIDSLDDRAVQYHSTARVGDQVLFTIESALGPLLPMASFIADDEIRQQFNEINRPGEWSFYESLPENSEIKNELVTINSNMTFDKIIAMEPGVSLVAEKRINAAASYFRDHFPQKPVLPMTVLLECKSNLAREFVARAGYSQNYQVSELRKIKMNEFVQPGDVLVCHVKVKEQNEQQLILNYRSEVDGKRVCVVDIVLQAKGI